MEAGGTIEFGGKQIDRSGFYVEPTIISGLSAEAEVVQRETFAPIVYVLEANSLEEAIDLNNSVEQGLSSSLFTKSIGNVFQVNICTTNQSYVCLHGTSELIEFRLFVRSGSALTDQIAE